MEIKACVLHDRKGITISHQGMHYISGHTNSFDVQSKCPHLKCSGRSITVGTSLEGVHFLYDVNNHGLYRSFSKPGGLTKLGAKRP